MKKSISSALIFVILLSVMLLSSCSDKTSMLSSLEINGNKIECRMDMSNVLDMFKNLKYEYSDSISCAYNGLDKIYDFSDSGFVVYTYPDGDKDYVLEVTVSSEEIKQQGGKVFVGMTKDELVALYGEEYTEDGDVLTYKVKDEQTMYFLIDGNKVVEYSISVAE